VKRFNDTTANAAALSTPPRSAEGHERLVHLPRALHAGPSRPRVGDGAAAVLLELAVREPASVFPSQR
jgi:hypothetical protein